MIIEKHDDLPVSRLGTVALTLRQPRDFFVGIFPKSPDHRLPVRRCLLRKAADRIEHHMIDDKKGIVESQIHAYVPMHNVTNLFESYKKKLRREPIIFEE